MDEILDFLKYKMTIDEVTSDPGSMKIRGTLYPPVQATIREIKKLFATTDYTPLFYEENGRHVVQLVVLRKVEDKPKYWLNAVLFVATLLSTTLAGYYWNDHNLVLGMLFSFSIMAILTCHELGHYFVSKKAGMITSLPYFIPVPGHPLGTFGAVIRMKSIVPNRSNLVRVGMAGPLSGFLVALPITVIGLILSDVRMAPEGGTYMSFGGSLLFYLLVKIIHPHIAQGTAIFFHPMAFAGWLGFLVTSMNLIPIGQLDGGHVAYSLFLAKRRLLYIPLLVILTLLGIQWPGWFVWALLAFLFARRDPIVQDSLTPLSTSEKALAILTLILLGLTFIPKPFAM